MIRLVPESIHAEHIGRATLYDWHGPVPQFNSIDGALILAAVQRAAGYWRVVVVDDIRGRLARWWNPAGKVLPAAGYRLRAETGIHWISSVVQRTGLAVRETIIESPPPAISGIEIVAYAVTTADLCRAWYMDRSKLDGFDGVNPRSLRAGRASKPLTPERTQERVIAAKGLDHHYHTTAGKRLTIRPEGISYE